MAFFEAICEILLLCTPQFDEGSLDIASKLELAPQAHEFRARSPKEQVAVIFQTTGTALVKLHGSAHWLRATSGLPLQPGDKIQTLAGGTMRIEYYGTGASILMNQLSYLQVARNPPQFSRFKRKNGIANSKIWEETRALLNSSTIANPQTAERKKTDQNEQVLFRGLNLQRDTTRIPVLSPQGDVTLATTKMPAKMAITLESTWNNVGLWAYVWNVSNAQPTPDWIGYSRGGFSGIPFKSTGRYVVQIITEDESRTTRPIRVFVEKKEIDWAHSVATWLAKPATARTLSLELQ